MSSQKQDELQRKVEEVKQDADVQRALQQATPTEKKKAPGARGRDKFWIAMQLFLLIILGALYQFIRYRLPQFAYPLVLKPILSIGVVIVCFTVLRLVDVYFIGRVRNAVYQYNLKRVSRLVVWLVIAFFVLTIFFQNWYTALVSFGLLSLILGFALQTPITSFIGWVYILVREPYRAGDRIKIRQATGDVIDVNYLDTTFWEFGGDYLSTEHPSGRIIKFPNSTVLSSPVYNYTWPLFPYIWNEIKFHVAYNSDLEFVAATMKEVAEQEVGEETMNRWKCFAKYSRTRRSINSRYRSARGPVPRQRKYLARSHRSLPGPPKEAGRVRHD